MSDRRTRGNSGRIRVSSSSSGIPTFVNPGDIDYDSALATQNARTAASEASITQQRAIELQHASDVQIAALQAENLALHAEITSNIHLPTNTQILVENANNNINDEANLFNIQPIIHQDDSDEDETMESLLQKAAQAKLNKVRSQLIAKGLTILHTQSTLDLTDPEILRLALTETELKILMKEYIETPITINPIEEEVVSISTDIVVLGNNISHEDCKKLIAMSNKLGDKQIDKAL